MAMWSVGQDNVSQAHDRYMSIPVSVACGCFKFIPVDGLWVDCMYMYEMLMSSYTGYFPLQITNGIKLA
jgi:hypothetical protein